VSRSLGFVGVLVAIACGAYLFAVQSRVTTGSAGIGSVQSGPAAVGPAQFQVAVARLEAHRLGSGSYSGATLRDASGVQLVRADGASYCLQAGAGAKLRHLEGPGGAIEPGAC
jgi:hypothetical protein